MPLFQDEFDELVIDEPPKSMQRWKEYYKKNWFRRRRAMMRVSTCFLAVSTTLLHVVLTMTGRTRCTQICQSSFRILRACTLWAWTKHGGRSILNISVLRFCRTWNRISSAKAVATGTRSKTTVIQASCHIRRPYTIVRLVPPSFGQHHRVSAMGGEQACSCILLERIDDAGNHSGINTTDGIIVWDSSFHWRMWKR